MKLILKYMCVFVIIILFYIIYGKHNLVFNFGINIWLLNVAKEQHLMSLGNAKLSKVLEFNSNKSYLLSTNVVSTLSTLKVKQTVKHVNETEQIHQNWHKQQYDKIVLVVVCCGERLNETKVMIKSAVALSWSLLQIIVFTEETHFRHFRKLYSEWPLSVQRRVILDVRIIIYPDNQNVEDWKNLFKPCSSQRLFLPTVLKDVDSVLYVDTDILFLSSVEAIWYHFKAMNSSHMAGMSPEHEDMATGWYNRFAKHPFYGRLGVNSGVMLMNLTRMRSFGWEEYVLPIYQRYKLALTWGDQDIINIIFHYHHDKLYIFDCGYNLRPDHCMYMSFCKAVSKTGVFILHGNRGVFHSKKQPAFAAVYKAWEMYCIGGDLKKNLLEPLEASLSKTVNTNCGKLQDAFMKNLQISIDHST